MKKIIIPCIGIFLLNSCHNREIPMELKAGIEKNKETFTISHKSINSFITLPGEFLPFEEVELFPKVNGFVKEVLVDRGFEVRKGQSLLVMEAPEIEQQLLLAKSKLIQAEAILSTKKERNERLLATAQTPGSVSPFDLESAQNEFLSAQASVKTEDANVAAFKAMTDYMNIRAPFDGIITQRNVHPGAFIGPNSQYKEPVLILKQVNKLRLIANVPETYANKIDLKSDVIFIINAIPNKEFKGKISRSAKSVNNQTRSEAVEIDVIDQHEIMPGMYAEVRLPVTASGMNSFSVPFSAILTNTERKFIVAIDKQNHAHLIDVREGITDGKTTEVFGEIEDGTEILIHPGNEIKEGQLFE